MSKKNQKYQHHTEQYKEAACRLVTQEGYTPRRAAESLGIPESTLVYWLRLRGMAGKPGDSEATPARGGAAAADPPDPKAMAIQSRELEAKVRRLEMEKEILKKATAYFASLQP